jgi:hypothetical protein
MSLDLTGEGRAVEAAQADRAFDRLIRLAGLSAETRRRSTMAEREPSIGALTPGELAFGYRERRAPRAGVARHPGAAGYVKYQPMANEALTTPRE